MLLTKKLRDEIFEGFGPLASLAARTKVAYCLGCIEPSLQIGAPVPLWMNSDAFQKLAYADDAEIKQIVVRGLQPARHAQIGLGAAQFGRDIGIEQKALAHARSTGRGEFLLRLKSRSSPFQGESSNSSTRLLRPGGR